MIKHLILFGTVIATLVASDRYIKIDNKSNYIIKSSTSWIMTEDTETNLVWHNPSQSSDGVKKLGWSDALAYCSSLVVGGKTSWRVPNRNEILTLVDYTKSAPAIDRDYITDIGSFGFIWTSTTYNEKYAYYVSPSDGLLHYADKESGNYATLCVWSE